MEATVRTIFKFISLIPREMLLSKLIEFLGDAAHLRTHLVCLTNFLGKVLVYFFYPCPKLPEN